MRIHKIISVWNKLESPIKAFLICEAIYILLYILIDITEAVIWAII